MNRTRPPTLQTIADAVGVSRTTVSNAYNRPDQLAPALRERILGAARTLGYAGPDPAARRLRTGGRDAVGVLLGGGLESAFADPEAAAVLRGIARTVEAAGVPLLLLSADQVRDAVVRSLCIYGAAAGDPGVAAALARGLPLVMVDTVSGGDRVAAGVQAGRRLLGLA
jgi:DNA-binding LacI/PurR family transcriptional regulator